MFSMHTAHLANVSKSVTKNATFPRTGGLPCLITHSCMSAASPTVVGGLIFCISATPQPGCLFPLFHGFAFSSWFLNIFLGGRSLSAANVWSVFKYQYFRITLRITRKNKHNCITLSISVVDNTIILK